MKRIPVLILLTLAATLAACKSSAPSAEAAAPSGSSAAASSGTAQKTSSAAQQSDAPQYLHSSLPTSFQTLTLTDPVMRMKAYDVVIPTGWKFDGVVAQGTACNTSPFPVFRAYSPDGLSEFRREPRLDWASSNNAVAQHAAANCPQLSTSITAANFLRYFAGANGAEWTAVWPLLPGSAEKFQDSIKQVNANYKQYNMPGYNMIGDVAAARTMIHNGSFLIEQQLLVAIICTHTPLPDGTFTVNCTANVRALRAPQGQLDAVVALMDGRADSGATDSPAWDNALSQAAMQRNQQVMAQRAAAFNQWSNMMAQEHSQFMQQFNAEGAARTANFNAQQNAKSTAASDWVDYALNQQTVTGSGGTQKVSSTGGTTWSNGQGQTYQTNDTNANPNGVLSGNWTRQQVVHGNGQPIQ
jgi:hypothetical protein